MISILLQRPVTWKRKWQLALVFLPGESQGQMEPGGLQSTASQRVNHDWAHTYIKLLTEVQVRVRENQQGMVHYLKG